MFGSKKRKEKEISQSIVNLTSMVVSLVAEKKGELNNYQSDYRVSGYIHGCIYMTGIMLDLKKTCDQDVLQVGVFERLFPKYGVLMVKSGNENLKTDHELYCAAFKKGSKDCSNLLKSLAGTDLDIKVTKASSVFKGLSDYLDEIDKERIDAEDQVNQSSRRTLIGEVGEQVKLLREGIEIDFCDEDAVLSSQKGRGYVLGFCGALVPGFYAGLDRDGSISLYAEFVACFYSEMFGYESGYIAMGKSFKEQREANFIEGKMKGEEAFERSKWQGHHDSSCSYPW